MKKLFILSLFCLALEAASQVIEQPSPITTVTAEQLPYGKGNWEFILRENISFESRDLKAGDNDLGSASSFGVNLGTNYFVADHIAVGLQFDADFNKVKSVTDFIVKQNEWMMWGNFTYMTGLSESINIYGRAGIGVGGITETVSGLGQDQKDKVNIFGYKAEVGFPIQVASDAPLFFTPRVFYRHLNYDFDGGEEKINRFGLGLNFETYLPCRQMGWDRGNSFSSGQYSKGNSYLGFYTRGMLSFGSNKIEYDDFDDDEENYFAAKLAGEYMYYAFNKVAVGAQLRFTTQKQEDKVSGAEYSSVTWGIRPTIEFNMPGKAQNLFLRGGVGFGGQTDEYDYNGNNQKQKVKIMNYGAGLGYNIFIAKRLSLTPIVGYESETFDFDDEEEDDKANGFDFSMGMRYHF